MARPKKSGKRAIGIQGRQGFLYIIKNQTINDNGKKRPRKNGYPPILRIQEKISKRLLK
ncbi:MAG: hypothetical protein K6B28_12095 [Lachnospiraceae bacterium]|nr:hypothetical protein [Lachnospiraceae bacterium]